MHKFISKHTSIFICREDVSKVLLIYGIAAMSSMIVQHRGKRNVDKLGLLFGFGVRDEVELPGNIAHTQLTVG